MVKMKEHKERAMSEKFAQKLKYFRELRGYTFKKLEELSGVDSGYIHKMETLRRRAPSVPIIQDLADALNVNITDLIDIEMPDSGPLRSVQELLVFNDYLVKGKLPTNEVRENLFAVIQTLMDCEWKENKHVETCKIMDVVNRLLISIN